MFTLLFLLFILNGYPSDKVAIPMTIALVVLGIVNGIRGIKDEKNYR